MSADARCDMGGLLSSKLGPGVFLGAQVINYVLTRPAREALYTVVEPEEIYKAKMCIDTVIVRLGDTVAAGLFQVLEGFLHAGKPHEPTSSLSLLFNLGALGRALGSPSILHPRCIP